MFVYFNLLTYLLLFYMNKYRSECLITMITASQLKCIISWECDTLRGSDESYIFWQITSKYERYVLYQRSLQNTLLSKLISLYGTAYIYDTNCIKLICNDPNICSIFTQNQVASDAFSIFKQPNLMQFSTIDRVN